ncbi:NADP-dependent oxidoreductase domain-containing protein [Dichotomocladium elegans]|nr:NADP-dependent oxidoreductase domain-containing protein [Dichotomocladium elegans]
MIFARLASVTRHSRHYTTNAIPTSVIPKTGRQVSRLGFGAYRVSKASDSHAEALRNALKAGVSIIDTASNFSNGASEEVIGDTIQDLVTKGELDRASITVVTKAGYLTPDQVDGLERGKDYVQINEKSFHGISPRVLEREIGNSLDRLKTKTLDVFLINAPERMLAAKNRSYTASHLYGDLTESFRYLDSLVDRGVVGGYGICSNTMGLPTAADHVSLADVLRACAKPEHFVAVEAPFNLFEREVVIGEPGIKTVSDIAKENDVYLMVNRPLNAIANGQIRVLVNHVFGDGSQMTERGLMDQLTSTFKKVSSLEAEMMSELPLEEEGLTAKFVWGQVLSENLSRLAVNHFATRHYLEQQVLPAVEKDVGALRRYAARLGSKAEHFEHWIEMYLENIQTLTNEIVSYAYIDTLRKNGELDRILNALSPTLSHQDSSGLHSPLSVKALRLLFAQQQVGTVFTGMRKPSYVRDAVKASLLSSTEPLEEEDLESIWACPIFQ